MLCTGKRIAGPRPSAFLRCASSTASSSSSSSSLSPSPSPSPSAKRNPYRPEPIQPDPRPRRVVVKNLKFGRLVEAAASSASETARTFLAATNGVTTSGGKEALSDDGRGSRASSSTTTSSERSTARLFAGTAAASQSADSLPDQAPRGRRPVPFLALAAAVGAFGYWYYSSSAAIAAEATRAKDYAVSNDPYDPALIKTYLSSLPLPPTDDRSLPMSTRMEAWVKSLQVRIVEALEAVEASPVHSTTSSTSSRAPQTFMRDSWLRKEGGEGISCVLQDGRVFEKSGVNVSVVHGTLPPPAVRSMTADHEGKFKGWYDGTTALPFKALGISCVIHPHNPAAPTVHFNYRYFEVEDPAHPGVPKAWWFGGGSDLTPSYLYPVDATHFHTSIASKCDASHPYPKFKAWCDRYFHIKHRGETRGVGGIFFDDLSAVEGDEEGREALFAWVRRCGEGFVESYVPIVQRRMHADYTRRMKQWQQLRRGRYVEFNLVYDRGTQFGLRTPGARIESILMSLPLSARWEYYAQLGTEEGSEEAKLVEVLKNPREWVDKGSGLGEAALALIAGEG
ncbi:MAG: Coproporphyrinogen-III oxidase [Cyphobasidiales sp. Tagirdzhanova-0007]|nr:MAG: Coproporphyrinogen-III oxidase [Cyphobasidiales sp. Tagirdzhanova-0007]